MPESASIIGTIQSITTSEEDIRVGGRTMIITLTDVFWATAVGFDNATTQAIIDGLDSNHNETLGWDNIVKAGLAHGDLVRTSDQVVTITFPAFVTFNILVDEIITITIPDIAYETFQGIGGAGGDPGDPGGEGENVHQVGLVVLVESENNSLVTGELLPLTLDVGEVTVTAPVVNTNVGGSPVPHTLDVGLVTQTAVDDEPDDTWFTSLQSAPLVEVKFIHVYSEFSDPGEANIIPRSVTTCLLGPIGPTATFNPQGTAEAKIGSGAEEGTGTLIPPASVTAVPTPKMVFGQLFNPIVSTAVVVAPSVSSP